MGTWVCELTLGGVQCVAVLLSFGRNELGIEAQVEIRAGKFVISSLTEIDERGNSLHTYLQPPQAVTLASNIHSSRDFGLH